MGLLLTLSAESYLKSFGPANAKQGLVFPEKLYGFLIPIITTTKASAKRRLGEEGGGEAAAKVYHPHKQFVKSWLVVESSLSFVVLVITHFFLTLLLSCLLLLSILNHKHRKLRAQCTLLTISCSARKLMQYSIVVPMVRRRRKNPLTDAIAICLVLDANFTKRIWHCFQNFKNFTVYTLVQSEKLIPKRQKYRQTVFRVCFQLWTQRCCQNCVLKYFRKSTLPGNL